MIILYTRVHFNSSYEVLMFTHTRRALPFFLLTRHRNKKFQCIIPQGCGKTLFKIPL